MAVTYIRHDPTLRRRRTAGLAGVIAFHVLMIWALVSGLAQTVVKVVAQKVEVSVISEPPPPPPPPPPKIEKVVPQKTATPQPQAYVPPVVNPPPVTTAPQNAISATTSNPAPQPMPAPVPPAPVEASKTPVSAKANCSQLVPPEYPAKAQEDEIQGAVHVTFRVGGDGRFSGIANISFDGGIPPRYRSAFQSAIAAALRGYSCKADALLSQEFAFKLESGG